MEQTQTKFEGWAILELFGHNREAGFITTQYFGNSAMFQLDVPELKEREFELPRPQWIDGVLTPKGSKVKKDAKEGRTRLINPSACYAINPCSKDTALAVLEELAPRDMKVVELAKTQQIAQGQELRETYVCDECGGHAEEGHGIVHADGCEDSDMQIVDAGEEERLP